MSKPIEAGCRAVVVNSAAGNNGLVVTVDGLAGPPGFNRYDPKDGQVWRTKEPIPFFRLLGDDGAAPLAPEKYLRRIDDDHELGSWDDCVWKPDSLKTKKEIEHG